MAKRAGVLGIFSNSESLLKAMKEVHGANYASIDAFTPYPVHGLDDAMGIKRSFLPYITFVFGATGTCLAFALQYWTSAVDWPIIVGGKPFNSWPAWVPVMFEVTILLAGISTVFGMFAINRLPNLTKKTFDPRLTVDRFAILIEDAVASGRKKFDVSEAKAFLEKNGAQEVREVFYEGWF